MRCTGEGTGGKENTKFNSLKILWEKRSTVEFQMEIPHSNNNIEIVLGWYFGFFELEDDHT